MHFRILPTVVAFLIAAALHAADPVSFKVGDLDFKQPATWQKVETTSSMRKAQLKVPADNKGEAGEVVFFHFGAGGGGGIQENVSRWLSQFVEPKDQIKAKTETVTLNGRKITFVQGQGTYKSGMPGGPQTPKPNFALLGAIVESAEGNVFIRLTGPMGLVEKADEAFRKMVSGM